MDNLRPQISCCLITTIISQRKKDIVEIENSKKMLSKECLRWDYV